MAFRESSQYRKPLLPLPPPLRGAEVGSFAHDTIVRRLPNIARRVLQENQFSPAIVAAIEALITEIGSGTVQPIHDPSAPDEAEWMAYTASCMGQNWLEIPWYFAEAYFYRRIIAATQYFQPGETYDVDPYAFQKRQGLAEARSAITALSDRLDRMLHQPGLELPNFGVLLEIDLWGNQMDLSLFPAGATSASPDDTHATNPQVRPTRFLVNQIPNLLKSLDRAVFPLPQVDLLVDNAGFELVCDLALAAFLLERQVAQRVILHVKSHPTFVSDATVQDVHSVVASLKESMEPNVQALGAILEHNISSGALRLRKDFFWTSPLVFWQMPEELYQHFQSSSLAISKGDANYRRLLGDLHWSPTDLFASITNYFPAPLAALRVLKSEVICGLEPGMAEKMHQKDPRWLTSGDWGMVQYRPSDGF
ncbi:MAG TPA: damage-control phosphatase ARMT1 family protein [Anaerolineaceae bacterium]